MAMAGFISSRASSQGARFEGDSTVLGPTAIGLDTIVGSHVVIGYPARSSVRRLLEGHPVGEALIAAYDAVSHGAKIGGGCFIRSGSVIYEDVVLEDGVETGHHVLVRENSRIGEGARIGTSTIVDGHVTIGGRANVQSNCYLPPGSVVEEDVFLGPCVTLLNDRFPPSRRLSGVTIRRGAIIGGCAVLTPGVTVGVESIVTAGAIVTRDVPPGTVVRSPVAARHYATRGEYEQKKRLYEEGS